MVQVPHLYRISTQVSLYWYWSKYSNLNHFQTNMWRAQESSWHKKKKRSLRFRDIYDVWKKHDELMKLKSWDLQVPSFLLKGEKCEPLFIFWHTMQQQKIFFAKRRDLKYWENNIMDPRANNGAVGGANEDGKPIGGINRDSMVCSINSDFRNVIFMIKALTTQWDVIRFNELDLGMFFISLFLWKFINHYLPF